MASYMGGSAPAMAAQIGDGYIVLSAQTLKGFLPGELTLLRAELEKLLRDARSSVPVQDDAQAQQARNRRIARLSSSVQAVGAKQLARR